MEEYFEVFTKGPGRPFRIKVNKIWIENNEIYLEILGWNVTMGLPSGIFKNVRENVYCCQPAQINGWILYKSDVKKTQESQVKEFKDRVKILEKSHEEEINLEELIIELKNNKELIKKALKTLIKSAEEKLKFKALRSCDFFTSRIKEKLKNIEIPEQMYYISLKKLSISISKLLDFIKNAGSKSVRDFNTQVQSEVAEINFLASKLEKKNMILKKKLEIE